MRYNADHDDGFCLSANGIIHAGATPVIANFDPMAPNVGPACVKAEITLSTHTILPCYHLAGRPWHKTGTFGCFGCFGSYVTRNVVTGVGGVALVRPEEEVVRTTDLAQHSVSKDASKHFSDEGYTHYEVVKCNSRCTMMGLHAAIDLHQFPRVDANWLRLCEVWHRDIQVSRDLPIEMPAPAELENRHAHQFSTILVDVGQIGLSRDAFLDAMTADGIGASVSYLSTPETRYIQRRHGWKPEDYTKRADGRTFSQLPLPRLSEEVVQNVFEAIYREIVTREPVGTS